MDKNLLENPLVSIVIPMYNSEKFIGAMIDSIFKQTYINFEVLVIDDGSKDKSLDIVEEYSKKDNRISIYQRPPTINKGANSCRNYGLEKSSGKYIIFVDSDDILAPYALLQRVQFMESHQEIDFGVFSALSINEEDENFNSLYYGHKLNDKTLNNLINKCLPFITWCLIFRKDALISSNITWDENLLSNQDADFNITCITKGLKFKYSDSPPDYIWRQVNNSIWHRMIKPEQAESHIYYFNKLYNKFKDDKEYSTDLSLLAIWLFSKLINNPKYYLDKFLSIDFFKKKKLLKKKLLSLYKLNYYKKIELKYILVLFFPYLQIITRYKEKVFPFTKIRRNNVNYLINQYLIANKENNE